MEQRLTGHQIRKQRVDVVYKKIEELYFEKHKTIPEIVRLVKQPNGRPYSDGTIRQILYKLKK